MKLNLKSWNTALTVYTVQILHFIFQFPWLFTQKLALYVNFVNFLDLKFRRFLTEF